MKYTISLFLSAFIMLSNGCTISGQRSSPSGDLIVQKHVISDFSELKVTGVFNLYLSQGDQVALRIEADGAFQKNIDISSKGKKLVLDFERNKDFFEKNKVNVYLTIKQLEILEFDGVGFIKTESPLVLTSLQLIGNGVGNINLALDTKDLNAKFNLVGNITLRGEAQSAFLKNDGVGNLDASEFITDFLILESDGIGKASVYSEKELSITANGIGKVSYSGGAKILKLQRNGIGKIEKTKSDFKNKW